MTMLQLKEHFASKILVIVLTIVLVTPLFVKLNHIFEDHKHEICKTPYTNHFHELEIDCEFYDFRLNTEFNYSYTLLDIPVLTEISPSIISQYHFVSDYQQLQFSLRGPPQTV